MKVSVIGCGYVGLISGIIFAYVGHQVVCYDIDNIKISKLKRGIMPIYEKDLNKYFNLSKNKLEFTNDFSTCIDTDIMIVAVGTPENKKGEADLSFLFNVCDKIIRYAKNNVTLVIKSTVPFGTCSIVDKYLKKRRNDIDFLVISNPEFLSQGNAIFDMLNADRIIVGANNDLSFSIMRNLYNPLLIKSPNIKYLEMTRENAELVKYAANCFLALKISFINEISNLCESNENLDINDVSIGIGYDKRIGKDFLKAGIGYGGSCLPKDTKALLKSANSVNIDLEIIKSCIKVNEKQRIKLYNNLLKDFKVLKGKSITIFGVTYKANTDDLRESPAIYVINKLINRGAFVKVFDPIAISNLKSFFTNNKRKDRISYFNNMDKAIKGSDAVLIFTDCDDIINYDIFKYKLLMKTANIYDGRNCYNLNNIVNTGIYYVSIGRKIVGEFNE